MGGEMAPELDDSGWVMTQLQNISDKLDMEEKCERAKEFATQHPIYTLFLIVTIATCCIPVICFLTILLGSMIFGILGFVFFEGTIVVFSTVILGGVLCFTTVLACGLSGCLVVTYYSVTYMSDLLKQKFPSLFNDSNSSPRTETDK